MFNILNYQGNAKLHRLKLQWDSISFQAEWLSSRKLKEQMLIRMYGKFNNALLVRMLINCHYGGDMRYGYFYWLINKAVSASDLAE